MQTNPIHNYKPISEEDYADLKFDTEETRPYTYDLDQRDKGVSKFDILMDNTVSGVNALIKLNEYAVSPVSKFRTPELDWNPEYNSAMEEIVSVARENPVKFTKAVVSGAVDGVHRLITDFDEVVPEYLLNLSNAVKDHFTKSIDDYLIKMYGPEVTVFNATAEQMTEARAAMLFRTLEASEVLGFTAAPKVAKTVAIGGMNSYRQGVDFIKYSAPKVKENILNIAETLSSNADDAMGLVPVNINPNRRNNTAKDKWADKKNAIIAVVSGTDEQNYTGPLSAGFRSSGWGSRETFPVARMKIINYFDELAQNHDYYFDDGGNFPEHFKKLSVFHQEETLKFLESIWQDYGWSIGYNNRMFTEIPDNLAKFDADKFIKGSFGNIKHPKVWDKIINRIGTPFRGVYEDQSGKTFIDPTNKDQVIKAGKIPNPLDPNDEIFDILNMSPSGAGTPPMFKLGDLLDHEELYKAYPEFRDLKIRFFSNDEMKRMRATMGYASQQLPDDFIAINYERFQGLAPDEYMDTLLHELQHAVEYRSGVEMQGRAVIGAHLKEKLFMADSNLKFVQEYLKLQEAANAGNKYPMQALHQKYGTLGDQVKVFFQGDSEGTYNIIMTHPSLIKDKSQSAEVNLSEILADDFDVTSVTDGSDWVEISLQDAEFLLKKQKYELKAKLASDSMMLIEHPNPLLNPMIDDVKIFSDPFYMKTATEIKTGQVKVANKETFYKKINQLAFESERNTFNLGQRPGNIFYRGQIDAEGNPVPGNDPNFGPGSDPVRAAGLNFNPDFFQHYLSQINEVMARITGESHKMTMKQRMNSFPFTRTNLPTHSHVVKSDGKGEIKNLFGRYIAEDVNVSRKVSVADLILSLGNKNEAVDILDDLKQDLVTSIRQSNVMKGYFGPEIQKAAVKANMTADQSTRYMDNWIDGLADAILYTKNNPHVTLGTNVSYSQMKSFHMNDYKRLKTFADGLSQFGLNETADVVRNFQEDFLTRFLGDLQIDELDQGSLMTAIDNIYRTTKFKLEETFNPTAIITDTDGNISPLSLQKNYLNKTGIKIGGKTYGGAK
jgi:hypothetical protein